MVALARLQQSAPDLLCRDLLEQHSAQEEALLLPHMTARACATEMARLGVGRLSVVNNHRQRHLLGMISLVDLARASMRHAQEESVREKILGF